MPANRPHTPHKTLLALHQLVDRGIEPLLDSMRLQALTEQVMTVDASELAALSNPEADPHAALVEMRAGDSTIGTAIAIAEPALCGTMLAEIWRSHRNHGAPLTQVESAILQQFLGRICGQWSSSWRNESISTLPKLTMATTLTMLRPQLTDGPWYVARTLIRRVAGGDAVGVLLFCYPAAMLPALTEAREGILWRSRIKRGLTGDERHVLLQRAANELRDVKMPVPVTFSTDLPLGVINQLEPGDVLAFDAPVRSELQLQLLDRKISGMLGRHGRNIALTVTGPHATHEVSAEEGDGDDTMAGYSGFESLEETDPQQYQ